MDQLCILKAPVVLLLPVILRCAVTMAQLVNADQSGSTTLSLRELLSFANSQNWTSATVIGVPENATVTRHYSGAADLNLTEAAAVLSVFGSAERFSSGALGPLNSTTETPPPASTTTGLNTVLEYQFRSMYITIPFFIVTIILILATSLTCNRKKSVPAREPLEPLPKMVVTASGHPIWVIPEGAAPKGFGLELPKVPPPQYSPSVFNSAVPHGVEVHECSGSNGNHDNPHLVYHENPCFISTEHETTCGNGPSTSSDAQQPCSSHSGSNQPLVHHASASAAQRQRRATISDCHHNSAGPGPSGESPPPSYHEFSRPASVSTDSENGNGPTTSNLPEERPRASPERTTALRPSRIERLQREDERLTPPGSVETTPRTSTGVERRPSIALVHYGSPPPVYSAP